MFLKRLTLVVLLALSVAQAAIELPRMPNPMASHFSSSGAPNDWSDPVHFFGLCLIIQVACAVSLMLVPLLSKLPTSMINMPNKDYWLAPERKEQTLSRLESGVLDFSIATQLLLLYAVHLTAKANLTNPPLLSSSMFGALVLYLIFTLAGAARLLLSFRIPRQVPG